MNPSASNIAMGLRGSALFNGTTLEGRMDMMSAVCPVEVVMIALGKSFNSRALSSSTALVEAVVVVSVEVVVAVSVDVVVAVSVAVVVAEVVEVSVVEVVAVSVAEVVVESVAVVVAESVAVVEVVVVHSVNVPATQEFVMVSLTVTVAMEVDVEVNVIETKSALPSAGEFNPESTKSSMSLMYSLFLGGSMGGRLIEKEIKNDSCMKVFIVP